MKVSGLNLNIGYGRVSLDSLDVASQFRLLGFRFAELSLKPLFLEEPSTGRDKQKPLKDGIMEAIKQDRVKTLMIYAIDRICYGSGEFEELWSLCRKHGCRLISITEGIDSNNPMCEIVGTLLATLSKMEHAKLKQRTTDKMQWNKQYIPLGGNMVKGKKWVTKAMKAKVPAVKAAAAAGIALRTVAISFGLNYDRVKWIVNTPIEDILTKAELFKREGIGKGHFSLKVPENRKRYNVPENDFKQASAS